MVRQSCDRYGATKQKQKHESRYNPDSGPRDHAPEYSGLGKLHLAIPLDLSHSWLLVLYTELQNSLDAHCIQYTKCLLLIWVDILHACYSAACISPLLVSRYPTSAAR